MGVVRARCLGRMNLNLNFVWSADRPFGVLGVTGTRNTQRIRLPIYNSVRSERHTLLNRHRMMGGISYVARSVRVVSRPYNLGGILSPSGEPGCHLFRGRRSRWSWNRRVRYWHFWRNKVHHVLRSYQTLAGGGKPPGVPHQSHFGMAIFGWSILFWHIPDMCVLFFFAKYTKNIERLPVSRWKFFCQSLSMELPAVGASSSRPSFGTFITPLHRCPWCFCGGSLFLPVGDISDFPSPKVKLPEGTEEAFLFRFLHLFSPQTSIIVTNTPRSRHCNRGTVYEFNPKRVGSSYGKK